MTLVELMVTLSILAILLAMGGPSAYRMIQSSAVSNSVNGFMADMRFARVEAIRRGANVVMCRTNDADATTLVCQTSAAANGWKTGWFVFEDRDRDAAWDPGEPVLRRQSQLTTSGTILEGTSASTRFEYTPSGRLRQLTSTVTISFLPPGTSTPAQQRKLCVGLVGRVRIAGDGGSSC